LRYVLGEMASGSETQRFEMRDNQFYKDQLKPCPMCGGVAEHGMASSGDGGAYLDRWEVCCLSCGLSLTASMPVVGEWPFAAIKIAVENWNRRYSEDKAGTAQTHSR
jgi:hypothetical protein